MSLWDRWFGKPQSTAKPPVAAAQSSMFAESFGSVQSDAASPFNQPLVSSSRTVVIDGSAPRPGERAARREMVYSSVRESMVRSGILSSGYKFKVLALDKRATQFIVMVDLADQFAASPDKLAQIEALIAYSAKSRFELMVKSVYWRLNSQLSVLSVKKPDAAAVSGRTEVAPQAAPVAMPPTRTPGIDPVEEAEIAAFKKALLEAAMSPAAAAPMGGEAARPPAVTPRAAPIVPPRPAAQKAPPPSSETNFGGLSTTQYGDLN